MKRLALIIGNANYPDPDSKLKNPVNDANAVQKKLERLSFKTIRKTDSTNIEMEQSLKEFSALLDSSEVALFFFAGHGMQIDGKNYLAAVNTDFDTEINAKYSSLLNSFSAIELTKSLSTNLFFIPVTRPSLL